MAHSSPPSMEHSISSCKHLYNRIKKAQDDIETEYLYVSTMMMLNEGVSPNKKGREEIAAFQLEHFDTYLSTLKMQLEEFETAVLSIGNIPYNSEGFKAEVTSITHDHSMKLARLKQAQYAVYSEMLRKSKALKQRQPKRTKGQKEENLRAVHELVIKGYCDLVKLYKLEIEDLNTQYCHDDDFTDELSKKRGASDEIDEGAVKRRRT